MTDRRWIRRDDVLSRRVPDGILLLRVDASQPVMMSGSGAVLWELLSERRTLHELASAAAATCDVVASHITPDVERAVLALAAHGLVEEAA